MSSLNFQAPVPVVKNVKVCVCREDLRPEAFICCAVMSRRNIYKACPSESGTEVGVPLFPAVELCDFPGRWQCMSGEIQYTLDSGSVLLTEAEAR